MSELKLGPYIPLFDPDKANYFPPPGLEAAVQMALRTGQPLLLAGEPGTGKTSLAYYLAQKWGLKKPLVHHIRTDTSAVELFYRYDALRHFQYAQQSNAPILTDEEVERLFIHYNALGEAIRSKKRMVVLLDEIDKASRDLPNDILNAIDEMEFEVPEVNKVGEQRIKSTTENRPFVVLTSNSERDLPYAFLRRCVYYHIDFPSETELIEILSNKLKGKGFEPSETGILVRHFIKQRDRLQGYKQPATAELLQFAAELKAQAFPIESLEAEVPNDKQAAQLAMSYSLLAKEKKSLELLRGTINTNTNTRHDETGSPT